jgi:hypothetical protein
VIFNQPEFIGPKGPIELLQFCRVNCLRLQLFFQTRGIPMMIVTFVLGKINSSNTFSVLSCILFLL